MPKPTPSKRKKSSWSSYSPKRGKVRSLYKKPVTKQMPMKKYAPVPYVRHGQATVKNRLHRQRWGHSIPKFMSMSTLNLIRVLTKEGILRKWCGHTCPHCGRGVLGKLQKHASRGTWLYRCRHWKCQRFVQAHDFHPIFFGGAGNSYTPLNVQVSALFAAIAGVSATSTHLILDTDHKPIDRIYSNLEVARARYVERQEKSITYGNPKGGLCGLTSRLMRWISGRLWSKMGRVRN